MIVLWRIVSFSGLKTLFLHTFSHATSRSSRPNCSSHSCNCKTPTEPTINIAQDTILRLEHNRAVWWLPAVLQISGELVHPAKHSSRDTRGSHRRTQLHSTRVRAQFPGRHWPQEVWPLEANRHTWWDCKEEEASFSLHGLPVINDGPCSITMLQNLPTGRCLHPTWRVTR